MASILLELIGKPGCHLCDDAREVVETVLAEFAPTPGEPARVEYAEADILQDAGLHELYAEEIPVVRLNGRVHNYWRIDPERLRTALTRMLAAEDAAGDGAQERQVR